MLMVGMRASMCTHIHIHTHAVILKEQANKFVIIATT